MTEDQQSAMFSMLNVNMALIRETMRHLVEEGLLEGQGRADRGASGGHEYARSGLVGSPLRHGPRVPSGAGERLRPFHHIPKAGMESEGVGEVEGSHLCGPPGGRQNPPGTGTPLLKASVAMEGAPPPRDLAVRQSPIRNSPGGGVKMLSNGLYAAQRVDQIFGHSSLSQIVTKSASAENHSLCVARRSEIQQTVTMATEDKNGGPNNLRAWREFHRMSREWSLPKKWGPTRT
jgi:hypothetical protein